MVNTDVRCTVHSSSSLEFTLSMSSSGLDETISQNTTIEMHVQGFVTSNIYFVSDGADCKIFKYPEYANIWYSLNFNIKFKW